MRATRLLYVENDSALRRILGEMLSQSKELEVVGAIFDATLNWNIALFFPVVLSIALGTVGYFAGKADKILIEAS